MSWDKPGERCLTSSCLTQRVLGQQFQETPRDLCSDALLGIHQPEFCSRQELGFSEEGIKDWNGTRVITPGA